MQLKTWKKEEVAVIFIDYQPEIIKQIHSSDPKLVELNVSFLAKGAKAYEIPVIISTVGVEMGVNKPTIPSIKDQFPEIIEIDRSSMNSWEDENFLNAIKALGRKKLIFTGIWTEICLAFPVIDALNDGYEVMFIVDAVGGITKQTHEVATSRLIQAGAIPNTTLAALTELSPDWANDDKSKFRPLAGSYFEDLKRFSVK